MRKTIHTDELIEQAVSDYARAHGLSWSAAAVELIVRGVDKSYQWGDEKLQDEFHHWLSQKSAGDYDPTADQDGDYNFERFLVERIRPKHGGKREGAGWPAGKPRK